MVNLLRIPLRIRLQDRDLSFDVDVHLPGFNDPEHAIIGIEHGLVFSPGAIEIQSASKSRVLTTGSRQLACPLCAAKR
jgi:hypothetical protein